LYRANHTEEYNPVFVSKDILCKTCANKNGKTKYSNEYTKSNCKEYPFPGLKPGGVLFGKMKCPGYKEVQ
jgi:hypothetical protein